MTATFQVASNGDATLTAHAILVKARNRIASKRRWRKGRFATPNAKNLDTCQVCALGAISWAATGDPHDGYGTANAQRALQEQTKELGHCFIVTFNDAPDTTHADVLAAFDRAIAATA